MSAWGRASQYARMEGRSRRGPLSPRRAPSIKIAYQVISSPSCCRARRKPRTFSSMSPACACRLFSVVRSKWRSSSRISPRMADNRASCSWALQTILHTVSVRCPTGMELRMRQASRCWGDVREKERLSRRLSAMADTPRHLPHKALIPFGVQGYVVQDKRAAQAVCGRKVAF